MKNAEKKYQFEIRCEAAEIGPTLKSIISKIKKEVDDSEELLFKFELAAREMLANAIEHGCALAVSNGKNFDNLKIKTVVKITEDSIVYSVEDPGPGFDWKNYDLTTMPKFEEKGRGLKMINKVTEKMEFNQRGNKITVTFKI
ncbi:MAG: ATP-binding protein [Bacillota bacterium]